MVNVMIVDDEKLVRQGIMTTFPWEKHGFKVTCSAGSGEQALELLERERVDLLVTDLTMNGMSGLELIKRVRQTLGNLPVVILTCHDNFRYIQDAMRLGVLDYIVKTEIEDDVVDETLARIAARLREERPAGAAPATARKPDAAKPPAGEAELAGLRADWNGLEWVYDEERFEQLLRRTAEAGLDAGGLRSLLYPVALEWERLLSAGGLQTFLRTADTSPGWTEWEAWLRSFRASIRETVGRNTSRQIAEAIFRAVEHIRSGDKADIGEEEMARTVNMSRGYFSKSFKKVTGQPYSEYVRQVKLERAKEMILRTDEPITRVAELCGFSDYRYFSRLFRDYTGKLPTELRRAAARP